MERPERAEAGTEAELPHRRNPVTLSSRPRFSGNGRRGWAVALVVAGCLSVWMTPRPAAADEIEREIERLSGLTTTFSLVGFGLLEDLSKATPAERQHAEAHEAAQALIRRGAEAVPRLMAHVDDDRTIQMEPVDVVLTERYDFNSNGVGLPWLRVAATPYERKALARPYRVTVGDICFELIGEIVNRDFTSYSPSWGCCFGRGTDSLTTPSLSSPLRVRLKQEWGALTREGHRRSLLADFRDPDTRGRQVGAYGRLVRYFPEEVEPAVLAELRRPTFDDNIVSEFCEGRLYGDGSLPELRRDLEEFTQRHGVAAMEGLRDRLFRDLARLEWSEEADSLREAPPFGDRPRVILTEWFHYPAGVQVRDRPERSGTSEWARATLIGALREEESPAIGRAVAERLRTHSIRPEGVRPYLACLANRGQAEVLLAHLSRIDGRQAKADASHEAWLGAIATSRDPVVVAGLKAFLRTATNEKYFVAAADGEVLRERTLLIERVRTVLAALPVETDEGTELLNFVAREFPGDLSVVAAEFLQRWHPTRFRTVCDAGSTFWLTDQTDGAKGLRDHLVPYLDDDRRFGMGDDAFVVRELVARTLCCGLRDMEFQSDWPEEAKQDAIGRIKAACRQPLADSQAAAR